MSIQDNINIINNRIKSAAEKRGASPKDVLLIAVTKLHDPEEINQAIDSGITDIGENKVQEILDKYEKVKPVRWHLIGHLQRNKVKYIIDKVSMIHSVDSFRLAEEIEKRAEAAGIVMDILLQVNIAEEESKFGIKEEDLPELIEEILAKCPHIRIKGLMTIAPFFDDPEDARPVFARGKELFEEYSQIKHEGIDFEYLSMGMSGDFEVAIEEGGNCVRVGTAIFGNRDYRREEK